MNAPQMVRLKNLIANKRKESGISVAELGERAGVDRSTIWRLEQGKLSTPSGDSLIAIANVLDIRPVDLFVTVGWLPADELPSVGPYLRAKYDKLPDVAITEIEVQIEALIHDYGNDSSDHDELQPIRPTKEI
ncbi:helix-turn-helix domain-containing protein [Mycolicibacterium fluoranthenivorans]|uniref:Transcriptional regulator, contains XRE-family HTH domain n=1 Tax=Mycolicibacterium fluoranthenivorans TaxID=258505 RepID=A0A1G4WRJ2_9MYCO|nr:helix-turn-helix transcriptional regulator [Mycolicibacterium fluoranthenivorans]SCX28119.1 Transcriptional regulator, contains XRE-family HTH domain [Mycolicibacterium fluoranthenivorans]